MKYKINIFAILIIVFSGIYIYNNNAYGSVNDPCVLDLVCEDVENGTICCGVCQATGEITSCAFHPQQE